MKAIPAYGAHMWLPGNRQNMSRLTANVIHLSDQAIDRTRNGLQHTQMGTRATIQKIKQEMPQEAG